jgi:cyclopropane fatty-acyl-phospholipid synthase-like methyltransferase
MSASAPRIEDYFVDGSVWQLFRGANPYTFKDTYEVLRRVFGYELNYVNYGYWPDGIETKEPGRRLTYHLADSLGLESGQRLLEAGSGLGQASVDCAEHYSLSRVLGMNMCEPQVGFANALAEHRGLQETVQHKVCDACVEVESIEAGSFDHALAEECISHFPDPLAFLRGVRRVLSPGGRMAITVVTSPNTPGYRLSFVEKLFFGSVPRRGDYWADLFAQAGFQNIQSNDITHMVFSPLFEAVRTRLDRDPESMQFRGPIGRMALKAFLYNAEKGVATNTLGYAHIVGDAANA